MRKILLLLLTIGFFAKPTFAQETTASASSRIYAGEPTFSFTIQAAFQILFGNFPTFSSVIIKH